MSMSYRGMLSEHLYQCLNVLRGFFLREGDRIRNPGVTAPKQRMRAQVTPPSRHWEKLPPNRIRGTAGYIGFGGSAAAAYYLCLIWSNGLLAYVLAAWAAARLYRRGYNRRTTGGSLRRRYGGAWLDKRWHTAPWLGLLGLLCGIIAGFRELYRIAKQYEKEQRADKKKDGNQAPQ